MPRARAARKAEAARSRAPCIFVLRRSAGGLFYNMARASPRKRIDEYIRAPRPLLCRRKLLTDGDQHRWSKAPRSATS